MFGLARRHFNLVHGNPATKPGQSGTMTLTNNTEKMCYDDVICEEECCHDLDFGIPYCCSKYTGFIYLGLMVGGGIIIAVLVIACYVFMKRTERELEAAARLEAAKAVNNANAGSDNAVEASSETDQTDIDNEQLQITNYYLPPPAYNDVMRSFTRCQSCDVNMTPPSQSNVDVSSFLARQHSEDSQGRLSRLPALVDVAALISRHRNQHGAHSQAVGLPLPALQESLENKLPTYEECTAYDTEAAARHRENPTSNDSSKQGEAASNILQGLGHFVDGGNTRNVKQFGESSSGNDSHFVNVSERLEVKHEDHLPPPQSVRVRRSDLEHSDTCNPEHGQSPDNIEDRHTDSGQSIDENFSHCTARETHAAHVDQNDSSSFLEDSVTMKNERENLTNEGTSNTTNESGRNIPVTNQASPDQNIADVSAKNTRNNENEVSAPSTESTVCGQPQRDETGICDMSITNEVSAFTEDTSLPGEETKSNLVVSREGKKRPTELCGSQCGSSVQSDPIPGVLVSPARETKNNFNFEIKKVETEKDEKEEENILITRDEVEVIAKTKNHFEEQEQI